MTNKVKNVLILCVNIDGNSPQPIRFRELISYWQNKASITLLTMNNFEYNEFASTTNFKVIKIEYSILGKILISKNHITTKQYISSKKHIKQIIREITRKIWRTSIFYRLMFPDKFIFVHGKIMQQIRKLKDDRQIFDAIIISASPFSLLKLGRKIKKLFPGTHCIYDTGDPFYGNTSKELIRPLRTTFARWFERKYLPDFENIVVPTSVLKAHYLSHFGDILNENKIHVIEQGCRAAFFEVTEKKYRIPEELKLLYAGGLYKDLREPFELYQAVRNYKLGDISLRIFGNIHQELLPEEGGRFYYGGSIPVAQLVKEYEKCDVTVFIDNKSGIQVPGKILELTGIKRPILFIYDNPASPTHEYLAGVQAIAKCRNNEVAICEALQKIGSGNEHFDFSLYEGKFAWPRLAEKYLQEVL